MEVYCTLIIEVWHKLNMRFDSKYLDLNTCTLKLIYISLNVRNGIEFQYPSIVVFLSILAPARDLEIRIHLQ